MPIIASPLSLLLLALAILNWFTGGHEGAVVIAAMVVLSSLFSFVQEYRSHQAAEALRALVHTKASLRRRMRQDDGTFPAAGIRSTCHWCTSFRATSCSFPRATWSLPTSA